MLIVSPLNPTWFAMLAITFFSIWAVTRYSRTHSQRDTAKILLYVDFGCIIIFYIYKFLILRDAAYTQLCIENNKTVSRPWTEYLCCHLCNMQMLLIPISILTKNRFLRGYCFLVTPLGIILAMFMPMLGFYGYSLLLPRIFGYYVTHLILLFSSISLFSTGLYKPQYKDIPKVGLILVCTTFMAFCVNLFLIKTGLATDANYFQTMGPNDNPVLGLIWNLIPYPWLYNLPVIPIVCLFFYLEVFVIRKVGAIIKGRTE